MTEAPQHPYPVGSRIRHVNQEWATGDMWTAETTGSIGPYPDGSWEYTVLAGEWFARRLDAEYNPMTRPAQWSSLAVTLVALPGPMEEEAA